MPERLIRRAGDGWTCEGTVRKKVTNILIKRVTSKRAMTMETRETLYEPLTDTVKSYSGLR
jgi:hypothetical protein